VRTTAGQIAVSTAVAIAFAAAAAVPVAGAGVCWRGGARPDCDVFIVTEYGIQWRLDRVQDARAGEPFDYQVILEVGPMWNLGEQFALGGAVYATMKEETALGIAARLRVRLGGGWSADVAPGLSLAVKSWDDDYAIDGPAATARLLVGYDDWFGATLGLEQVRVRDGESEIDLYGGFQLGSYPGAAAAVLFFVLVAAVSSGLGVTGT